MKTVELLSPNANYNAFINGNFDFWQRGTTFARTHGQNGLNCDRVRMSLGPTASKSMTINRSTSVPSGLLYPAFYSYEAVNNTAFASFSGSDFINPFYSYIEGNIFQSLIGKPFTLGFWMFATNAIPNYPVSFINSTSIFSYVVNISIASGWNYYAVQVPWHPSLDNNSNTAAVQINLGMVSGPTYQAPSTGSWLSGAAYYNTAASTNIYATAGFTQRFSQMQLRSGTWTANQMKNSFELNGKSYAGEIDRCQRYYEVGSHASSVVGNASGVLGGLGRTKFMMEKRVSNPAISIFGNGSPNQVGNDNSGATEGSVSVGSSSSDGFSARSTTALSASIQYSFTWTADAEI